jgi:hypothetical protein
LIRTGKFYWYFKYISDQNYYRGYIAPTGKYGDLLKTGIIDPTKVVRTDAQKQSGRRQSTAGKWPAP